MKASRLVQSALLALGFASLIGTAQAGVIINVPGTSDPWLAGMPNGSGASYGDVAPTHSPVQVLGLGFSAGNLLTFAATGTTDHCDFGSCGFAPAEGDFSESIWSHSPGAENGISDVVTPIDALIGVFLGPTQPNLNPAPGALNFSTAASRDFASLAPLLQQVFYIGNGLRNDNLTMQTFVVPTGATRLYLGVMDGYGWYNNAGNLSVTVDNVTATPEPSMFALMGLALAGLAARAKRKLRG